MRGVPSILSVFRNKLNEYNNTGVRMLDYIYHMSLRLLNSRILTCKYLFRNVIMDVITSIYEICKPLVV